MIWLLPAHLILHFRQKANRHLHTVFCTRTTSMTCFLSRTVCSCTHSLCQHRCTSDCALLRRNASFGCLVAVKFRGVSPDLAARDRRCWRSVNSRGIEFFNLTLPHSGSCHMSKKRERACSCREHAGSWTHKRIASAVRPTPWTMLSQIHPSGATSRAASSEAMQVL